MSPFLFSESSFAVLAASGKDRPCHTMRAWRSRTKRRRSWTSSPWNPTATRFQGNLWTLHAYVSVWTWNMDLFISYFSGKFDLYLRLTITIQITLPTEKDSAHNPMGYILIESSNCLNEPMYMLYFEETIYGAGHYQSIKPESNCNQILKHYNWKRNKSLSRTISVGEPITSSSRISEKRKREEDYGCEDSSKRSRLVSSDYNTSDALESIMGNSSRKVATGCHICKSFFRKNMTRKKCPCGLYCHKKCFGKCTWIFWFFACFLCLMLY